MLRLGLLLMRWHFLMHILTRFKSTGMQWRKPAYCEKEERNRRKRFQLSKRRIVMQIEAAQLTYFQRDWTFETIQAVRRLECLACWRPYRLFTFCIVNPMNCTKNPKLIRNALQQQLVDCVEIINGETFTSSVIASDLQLAMFTIKICASLNWSLSTENAVDDKTYSFLDEWNCIMESLKIELQKKKLN